MTVARIGEASPASARMRDQPAQVTGIFEPEGVLQGRSSTGDRTAVAWLS